MPACLLAYVGEAASLTRSLLCWGRMNVFFEHLCSIWLCSILLNPRGACSTVLLHVLLRNILWSLAAPFPADVLICCRFFPVKNFSKSTDFPWPFLRPPKASEGNLSSKKGLLDFYLKYLLVLWNQNYFIHHNWSCRSTRAAWVLFKSNCHKLQDELNFFPVA